MSAIVTIEKKAYAVKIKGTPDALIIEPSGTVKLAYDPNTPERRAARLAAIGKNR